MRICSKCGSYVPEGKLFCVSCGRPLAAVKRSSGKVLQDERSRTHSRIQDAMEKTELRGWFRRDNQHPYAGNTYEQHLSHDPNSEDYYKSKYGSTFKTKREESKYAPKQKPPVESELMAENILCIFAYIGCFFFIPLLLRPNSLYARFHANQGLILFVLSIVMGVLTGVTGVSVFSLVPVVFMGYGISNALQGKTIELPVIGSLQLLPDINSRSGGLR